jgi:hypothetical protein
LKDAGLLVGGAAIGSAVLLTACGGKTETETGESTKITVLNPEGQREPVVLKQLAPRLSAIAGKTIYVVDVKFPASKQFGEELVKVLKEQYPKTTWLYREKAGSYFADDPPLWAEIKEKGHGMVQFIGH